MCRDQIGFHYDYSGLVSFFVMNMMFGIMDDPTGPCEHEIEKPSKHRLNYRTGLVIEIQYTGFLAIFV